MGFHHDPGRLLRHMKEDKQTSGVVMRFSHEDPESPVASACLDSYFRELNARFEGGFDAGLHNTATAGAMRPPHGVFIVAWLEDEPCGCGALLFEDGNVAEIKRMWVASQARGRGVARRLLEHLEQEARRHGIKRLRLDTNRALTEAHKLYSSSGYAETGRFNDNPYAHKWFEKML